MKGDMEWLVISIIVAIIIMVIIATHFSESLDEVARTSARVNALRVAAVINTLQTSNDKTVHEYPLPAMKCIIEIGNRVNVTVNENEKSTYTVELLKLVPVENEIIECDPGRITYVFFVFDGEKIAVRQGEPPTELQTNTCNNNGVCELLTTGETCGNCPNDCCTGTCGDSYCDRTGAFCRNSECPETNVNCPRDCWIR